VTTAVQNVEKGGEIETAIENMELGKCTKCDEVGVMRI